MNSADNRFAPRPNGPPPKPTCATPGMEPTKPPCGMPDPLLRNPPRGVAGGKRGTQTGPDNSCGSFQESDGEYHCPQSMGRVSQHKRAPASGQDRDDLP